VTDVDAGSTAVGGPILIIGTGLIGASIGLALRRAGVSVALEDIDELQQVTAEQIGAGTRWAPGSQDPSIVVVAVPPRSAGSTMADACRRFPRATVTDVTSVKAMVLDQAQRAGADMTRVVGGHPMAGREVSGAAGARADLVDARWWILTPQARAEAARLAQVRSLVQTCGAYPVEMTPPEHDRAVALISHAPQVLSSVLAAQLNAARPEYVQIAGQGLRDMTRIAGSDGALWTQILAANAGPVAEVVQQVVAHLERFLSDLRAVEQGDSDAVAGLTRELLAGAAGRARIPGKHGAAPLDYAQVAVMVADRPGELARLFLAVGQAGINLEDVHIEHVLGRPSGLVELAVRPEVQAELIEALRIRDFDVRGTAWGSDPAVGIG